MRRFSEPPYTRFAGFAAVGLGVFFAAAAILYGLVHYAGIDPHVAYFITAIFSIEASFFLNRYFNWRDRPGSFLRQLIAFHITKTGTLIITQLLFAAFLAVHVQYMVAMVLNTGLITMVNYVSNDRFVFRHRHPGSAAPESPNPVVASGNQPERSGSRIGRGILSEAVGVPSPPESASSVSSASRRQES